MTARLAPEKALIQALPYFFKDNNIRINVMCINKNAELLPYYQKAKNTLDYNSDTGVFTRFIKTKKSHEKAGSLTNKGYCQIRISINGRSKSLSAHRLAWFVTYGELPDIIDHIDGDPSNNTIKNLRSCTHQQNQMNRGMQDNNKSGFKGVHWDKKSKKWVSQIGFKGDTIYIGLFDGPKKASEAYDYKARELFGEFYNS